MGKDERQLRARLGEPTEPSFRAGREAIVVPGGNETVGTCGPGISGVTGEGGSASVGGEISWWEVAAGDSTALEFPLVRAGGVGLMVCTVDKEPYFLYMSLSWVIP